MSYQIIWTLSDQLWRDKCAGKKPDCICALRKKTEDHVKDAVREERSQALRRHLLRQSRQEGVGTRPRAGSGGRRKLQEPFQGERQANITSCLPPAPWLEESTESPVDFKEITPVNPKGNQPWILIGRTDAEALILWPSDVKSCLLGKGPDVRKDWR